MGMSDLFESEFSFQNRLSHKDFFCQRVTVLNRHNRALIWFLTFAKLGPRLNNFQGYSM